MARNKTSVGKEEVRLVQRTAIYSLDLKRIHILNFLLRESDLWVSTSDIANLLCISDDSARYHLDDLVLLDLAKRRTILGKKGRDKHQWQLKQARMLRRILDLS